MASIRKMSAFAAVVISFFLLSLAGFILLHFGPPEIKELFGAQGGEMQQLNASRTPRMRELEIVV